MNTPAKHMLLTMISQHANYQEKQLVKSDELGKCAASIIKRLRRALRLYRYLFIAFLIFPGMIQMVTWVLSPDRPTMWFSFVQGGLCAMSQLPGMVMQHVSLARFETIVAMWLYAQTDETDDARVHSDMELAELIASDFQ